MDGPVARLCIPCHKYIHAIFTIEELAGFYHTLLRLQEHPSMEEYLKWVRKQAPGKKITIKKSNRKESIIQGSIISVEMVLLLCGLGSHVARQYGCIRVL